MKKPNNKKNLSRERAVKNSFPFRPATPSSA